MVSGPNLDTEAKYPQVSASMRIPRILLVVRGPITILLHICTYCTLYHSKYWHNPSEPWNSLFEPFSLDFGSDLHHRDLHGAPAAPPNMGSIRRQYPYPRADTTCLVVSGIRIPNQASIRYLYTNFRRYPKSIQVSMCRPASAQGSRDALEQYP